MTIFEKAGVLDWLRAVREVIASALARPVGCVARLFTNRDERLVIVFGRPGFSDNSKYLFIEGIRQAEAGADVRLVWFSREQHWVESVQAAGAEAVRYPSMRAFGLLLRAGVIATDASSWYDGGVVGLTDGAVRVQMWHGAPLKSIELKQYHERYAPTNKFLDVVLFAYKRFIGRFPRYDAVLATSEGLIEDAFGESFLSKSFFALGYPRNDVIFAAIPDNDTVSSSLRRLNIDHTVYSRIYDAKELGMRVILYVPTFRKSKGVPFEKAVDVDQLATFCSDNNILVVIKLHPFLSSGARLEGYACVAEYDPTADVYPTMGLIDVLVTDYSSIFFDFLLLDKPVVFFCHDVEEYIENDRFMYFDYASMTPGPWARDQAELCTAIEGALSSDEYAAARRGVIDYIHRYQDARSGERVLASCLSLAKEKIREKVRR